MRSQITPVLRTARLRATALAALLAASVPASAGAIFSTHGESDFFIGGADAVMVGSDLGDKVEEGDATAFHSGLVSGAGVFPATIDISTGGIVGSLVPSFAGATRMAGHVIRIDNRDTDEITTRDIMLAFSFPIFWSVMLGADDPLRDGAAGGVFFGISGFEAGIDAIDIDGDGLGALTDTPGTSAYSFNPFYTTFADGIGGSGFMTVTGKILVAADSIGEFSVITDSSGFAFHVPAPTAFGLMVACGALLLLGGRRRRLSWNALRI